MFSSCSQIKLLNINNQNKNLQPPWNLKNSPNLTEIFNLPLTLNNLFKSLSPTKFNSYGECSLAVEYEPVALGMRVRLPPFAFINSNKQIKKEGNIILFK